MMDLIVTILIFNYNYKIIDYVICIKREKIIGISQQ